MTDEGFWASVYATLHKSSACVYVHEGEGVNEGICAGKMSMQEEDKF